MALYKSSVKYYFSLSTKQYLLVISCILVFCLNSLPNDKIVDWSNSKASAHNKIYVTEKLKFVLGRVENITGKGENAGQQHFLLFT